MKSYLTGAEHKKVSELFKETMNEHVFNINNPKDLEQKEKEVWIQVIHAAMNYLTHLDKWRVQMSNIRLITKQTVESDLQELQRIDANMSKIQTYLNLPGPKLQ